MRMPHQGPKQGPPPDQEYQEPGAPGDDPQAPGEEGNQGEPPVMNPAYANQPPMPPGPSPQKSGWGAMPYGGNMAGGPSNINPYPTQILLPKQQRLQQQQQQQQQDGKKKGKKKKNNNAQPQVAGPSGFSLINPVLNLISLPPPPPPPLPENIPTPPSPRASKSEPVKKSGEKKSAASAGLGAMSESWPPSLQ